MFWLGLSISIASIPGLTSITIPAGWAALSCLLPLTLWRGGRVRPLHSFLFAFLAYAMLSLIWTLDFYNGIWRLWELSLFALAFHLGSTLTSLRAIWLGLFWGCVISTAVAIAQHYGFPVMTHSIHAPAGLHFNQAVQGMVLALAAIAMWSEGLWLWTLLLAPGLYLAHSRGAYYVLACALILRWIRWPSLVILFGVLTFFYAAYSIYPHDQERVQIWAATISYLKWFGLGAGSFLNLHIIRSAGFVLQPEYAHNDFLQLAFEFGIGAIPFLVVLSIALCRIASPCWLVFASALLFCFFTFPLYNPVPLFVLALSAGHLSRDWNWGRVVLPIRRYSFLPSLNPWRFRRGATDRRLVPVPPSNPQS